MWSPPWGKIFMAINISNFYLNTHMRRYKYMKMKLDTFPDDIIEEYNLCDKVEPDGYVYIEVCNLPSGVADVLPDKVRQSTVRHL